MSSKLRDFALSAFCPSLRGASWNISGAIALRMESFAFDGTIHRQMLEFKINREVVMSQLRLGCVAIAMWASSAWAQPLKPQENGYDHLGPAQTFKCEAGEHHNNRIATSDLPHTVIASLRLKNKKAAELKIAYVKDNGEKYSPTDETSQWHLVTIPGRQDYNWYAMVKGHNILMHGRLFEQHSTGSGENRWVYKEERWFYNEEKFEKGRKISEYRMTCQPSIEPSATRQDSHGNS